METNRTYTFSSYSDPRFFNYGFQFNEGIEKFSSFFSNSLNTDRRLLVGEDCEGRGDISKVGK